jgi:hypothetical protein
VLGLAACQSTREAAETEGWEWVAAEAREGDCYYPGHTYPEMAVYRPKGFFCEDGDRRISSREAIYVRTGRVAELSRRIYRADALATLVDIVWISKDHVLDGDCATVLADGLTLYYRHPSGAGCDRGDMRLTLSEADALHSVHGPATEPRPARGRQQASLNAIMAPSGIDAIAVALTDNIEELDEERTALGPVNIRERPDSATKRIATLGAGDSVTVLGRLRGSGWLQVMVPGGVRGYVLAGRLSSGDASEVAAEKMRRIALPPVERRRALVIGNADYRTLADLRNPVNDARAMASALRRLDFVVTVIENGTYGRMMSEIGAFGDRIERDGVGLFYYAGHAVQVRGENYLIPVEAAPRSEAEVSYVAVNAGYALAQFERAGGRVNIAIFDSCRDNPLRGLVRSASRGLAVVGQSPGGTMTFYATSPNEVALDGDGTNGLFTAELLRHIEVPGLRIEDLFKKVSRAVLEKSAGAQRPWLSSSGIAGDFYFKAAR